MTHETVATPWEQKGLVMRSLVEKADGELVLVDGVKVCHGAGWALALPGSGGRGDAPVGRVVERGAGSSAVQGLRPSHPAPGSLTGAARLSSPVHERAR